MWKKKNPKTFQTALHPKITPLSSRVLVHTELEESNVSLQIVQRKVAASCWLDYF